MKIHIPFLPEFEDAMLEGQKRATARSKRYGQAGDTFSAFKAHFKLVRIERVPLSRVADGWAYEGCASREDFIEVWRTIHPRRGWDPEQMIWWHWFERVPDGHR